MNRIEVSTDRELTSIEINQIKDIMLHSNCPNESLINSIQDCQGICEDIIVIGNADATKVNLVIEY